MPKCPDCGEEFSVIAKPVVVTEEHRQTIDRAVEVIRSSEGDELSEGRCLELACADFLAGVVEHQAAEEESQDDESG
jgi:hypothetical protein